MSALSKKIGIFYLTIACSLLAVSCAQTKISQCQSIIEITQKIAEESKENRQTKDIQKVLQVADSFEEAAEDMKNLTIEDEELIRYQTGLAEVYEGNGKTTRDFIAALQQKDITTAKLNQQKVQQIGQKEQELVTEMNLYCQGSE